MGRVITVMVIVAIGFVVGNYAKNSFEQIQKAHHQQIERIVDQ